MTTLSIFLLYGSVFVIGGLGVAFALVMTATSMEQPLSDGEANFSADGVDPIRSLGF